jgi:hypothetical protein
MSGKKEQYTNLFDSPEALFHGVRTILWPNDETCLWFTAREGSEGICVTVSNNNYGLVLNVKRITLNTDLDSHRQGW